MTPVIITIFAAILAIAGAIVQYHDEEEAKLSANEAKKEAAEFNEKLIQSQKDLITEQKKGKEESDSASKEIIRLNQELFLKTADILSESEKVKLTQQETIKFILGTETPEIKIISRNENEFALALYNNSQYPIYDVILKVQNFDDIIKCKNIIKGEIITIDEECASNASIEHPPFLMTPSQTRKFQFQSIEIDKTKHIRIECFTRTKLTIFCCIMWNVKGKIVSRIRVYNSKENKIELAKELDFGLAVSTEDYWETHFYLSKIMHFGGKPSE